MTLGSDSVCEFPVADGPNFAFSEPSYRVRDVWNDGVLDRWLGSDRSSPRIESTLSGLSRLIDILGASAVLLITFPFLIILSIALKLNSPGPLFYIQRRIGLGGQEFSCIKFRTMCKDADAALQMHLMISSAARAEWARDHKLRDDPRITQLGSVVRKLSLDEFPQLINILRGEMSLVGPRPIVRSEVTRYGRYFEEYCRVRPGLTGLWQVSGRNDVSYRRRVSIDCYYVRNKSLLLDLKILFRTVPVVLGAKGSY